MNDAIIIKGARENNLKNVDVEIPYNKLTVIAGVSGSGKSSLAFDVLYGEGQRRFMDAFSTGMKHFVDYLKKPNVDTISGLSPVVAIQQKTIGRNPRSTVGTMTDINDYLCLLFSNIGVSHCPYCKCTIPTRTPYQIMEYLMSLPYGTEVEITTPVFKAHGESYNSILNDYYSKGYRKFYVDGKLFNLGNRLELEEEGEYRLELVTNKFIISDNIQKNLVSAIEHTLLIGDGLIGFNISGAGDGFYHGFACQEHHITMGECLPNYFIFNNPDSACPTCSGLGTDLEAVPEVLIQNDSVSIKEGALVKDAFSYDKNAFKSMVMSSLALHYNFSLDTPFCELSEEVKDIIFYGSRGEGIKLVPIPDSTQKSLYANKLMNESHESIYVYEGLIKTIERSYRDYRKKGVATAEGDAHYKSIMVERECPDCKGSKLKRQRLLVEVNGANIHELSRMSVNDLIAFITSISLPDDKVKIGEQILNELLKRLRLLKQTGLGYLSLNRKSDSLSGGEAQRVRLSSQIGSELRGILYVLDEPSIGLHPKDNRDLIKMIKKLKEIGNTVVVVEHDEETICSADNVIEIGPGPGVYGGRVIAQGTIDDIKQNKESVIGQYLSGRMKVAVPAVRRKGNGNYLKINGASENNLKNVNVKIPLGVLICVTGVSGSGKSTLINQVLFKKLYSVFNDPTIRAGSHESIEGIEYLSGILNIDQTPIGKNCRSTPATYVGFYDNIRKLFAATSEAIDRKYTASRFSFNQKGGRCEECGGQGVITTNMHFMPDIETVCRVCNGSRYNRETLEIEYKGKNIADILDMSVNEAMAFFDENKQITSKLELLDQLGLGYLKLGQSSTTLSGGEAQRIKLATELGRIGMDKNKLYILDEPTTGLHIADIQKLMTCLNKFVDSGSTVIVIEHNMDFIKTADYIIDIGPGGGNDGGRVVAYGTPEEIVGQQGSYTAEYLRGYLDSDK